MAFAYSREEPIVHYSLFDKHRKLISNMKIPIKSKRMLHDFAATENYIVIPDLPMEMDPGKNTIKGKGFLYQLNKDKPARYGIMKRLSLNPDAI
jgi:carotenoid cleavage dioxygenase